MNVEKRGSKVGVGILLAFTFIGCPLCQPKPPTSREIWEKIVKGCSESDLIGKDVLFMGTSSPLGAGSILRKTNTGGYNPRWVASKAGFPEGTIIPGVFSSCKGTSTHKFTMSASVEATTLVPGLDASASADLKRAKDVTVSVESWRMDQVQEGLAESAIRNKTINSDVWSDLQYPDRFIVMKAILVNGLTAEVTFDDATSASLKAKYSVPGGVSAGPGLTASMTAQGTLKVTATQPFYIAAEIDAVQTTGFASKAPLLVKVKDLSSSSFTVE